MPATEPSPEILKTCERAGMRYREEAVRETAQGYDRQRHLARIVPLPPEAIADTSLEGTRHIVERLEEIARNLAKAARAQHWTYDTNRHIAALGALQAERAALSRLENVEKTAA